MIPTITSKEVQEKLANEETLYLIDVREDEEIAYYGKIPEAVHMKMGDIPQQLHLLDQDQTYIIICKAGVRSEHVCVYLQEQGYQVMNMVGGMLEYEGHVE